MDEEIKRVLYLISLLGEDQRLWNDAQGDHL